MSASPADTRAVYDRQAVLYDARRGRSLFEGRWLTRLAATLLEGAHVLDLGCGAGEPIAAWLMEHGYRVTGADFSAPMLEIARGRWPQGDWREVDMRTLQMPEQFDGIIGWNSFFHLTQDEQRACLPLLAAHLKPAGTLMLTVGHKAGEVTGTVGSETVFHASLSPPEYATILETNGLRLTGILAEDPDANGHTVLMAQKQGVA